MDTSLLVRILLILVALFVLFALVSYYNRKKAARAEHFEQAGAYPGAVEGGAAGAGRSAPADPIGDEPLSNEDYTPVDFKVDDKLPSDCFPKDRLVAEDLLPRDSANSKWSQVSPAGQGDLKDQNLLSASVHIGVDTQGSSMKNANLQLRADPICPRNVVSPWQQSSIEPDLNRKLLV